MWYNPLSFKVNEDLVTISFNTCALGTHVFSTNTCRWRTRPN